MAHSGDVHLSRKVWRGVDRKHQRIRPRLAACPLRPIRSCTLGSAQVRFFSRKAAIPQRLNRPNGELLKESLRVLDCTSLAMPPPQPSSAVLTGAACSCGMQLGLSVRASGRRRGVSHVAIMEAAKAGRIHLEPDGTIDPTKADAGSDRTTAPRKRNAKPRFVDARSGEIRH
jgi:hypothetical protein